jgi:hypothetical protein
MIDLWYTSHMISWFCASTLSPIIVEVVNFWSLGALYLLLGFNLWLTFYQFNTMSLVILKVSHLDLTTISYLAPNLMVMIPWSFRKDLYLHFTLASVRFMQHYFSRELGLVLCLLQFDINANWSSNTTYVHLWSYN